MSERNLPIKVVMPRIDDIRKNIGMSKHTFFCDVTEDLQNQMINKLEKLSEFYKNIFKENDKIPAIGKIKVKQEAIAKTHKPAGFCKKCPIIGAGDLDEIYIKITKKSIDETIDLVRRLHSEEIRANLTAIDDITPITAEDRISKEIFEIETAKEFDKIKEKIKIRLFNFGNEFDNEVIYNYVKVKLEELGLGKKCKLIQFGSNIKFLKVEVQSFDDVLKLGEINGIKKVDFFQEYTLKQEDNRKCELDNDIKFKQGVDSNSIIGIIDGGISKDNPYLNNSIYAREEYVPQEYQNPSHGTFIASTIQYGDYLNDIVETDNRSFKFLDVVAIPNSDSSFGYTDTIGEDELMTIISEVIEKYHDVVKVWNLSIGIPNKVCDGNISDLAIFCDYIQDKYGVQFIISSGNYVEYPFRSWPPQNNILEADRIISPADSIRAITAGSIAYLESADSIVKRNEPSPFSRRGPGANYIVKPDVVDYGGNCRANGSCTNLGVKGMNNIGEIVEGIGTSYSAPRITKKFANILSDLQDENLLLSKAMLIHSARMNSRSILDQNTENIKYYGFGMPSNNSSDILMCSENDITLVFKQEITQGSHLELLDFPFPASLIDSNNKCHGEICMTLVYNPPLNADYGKEYCRTNIDVSFGTYKYEEDGKMKFTGQVPLEKNWDSKFEKAQVENGFKWSPVKSYYRKISKKGIDRNNGWKLRINMSPRYNEQVMPQEFVLIVTIKDPTNTFDIYTDVVSELRAQGYVVNDLSLKQQLRHRQ